MTKRKPVVPTELDRLILIMKDRHQTEVAKKNEAGIRADLLSLMISKAEDMRDDAKRLSARPVNTPER